MSKINGFYRYKDKKGNYRYCYVITNNYDEIEYRFTDSEYEASRVLTKFCKDNGYNKKNIKEIKNDPNYNIEYTSFKEIKNKLKESHNINISFKDNAKNIKESFINKVKERFERRKDKPKNSRNILIKRVAIGVIFTAIAFIGGRALLNRNAGPTTDKSITATTVDDLDDININDNMPLENIADQNITAQNITDQVALDETINQNNNSQVNNSGSNNRPNRYTNNMNNNYGNNDLPSFQEPISPQPTTPPTQDTTPPSESSTDNTFENEENFNPTPSEGPSEVIDVPAADENENNQELPPTSPETPSDEDNNVYEEEIIFDDKFEGHEGAIENPTTEPPLIDESNKPLPNPEDTATDDYITTEDELNNNTTNDNTNITEPVEEVPVYQEKASNDQIIGEAVDAMANGTDVRLVFNAETGSVSMEQMPQDITINTNSLTK